MEPATVIVFGGSSGIGEATAKQLTSVGASVTIVGRSVERLERARLRIGGNVKTVSVDATDPMAVRRYFENVEPFDHLVLSHSAGKGAGLFRDLELDDVRNGIEAKLFSHLTVAQSALGKLKLEGSLTFVTSGSARIPILGTSGLAAINGAIEAMIPTLAKELAPLRINAVSPGVIDTPWWDEMPQHRDAVFKETAAELPMGRVGRPEDVASAIIYLMNNTFVTGTVLAVDGGAPLASSAPEFH